jgi:hypothetical protein
MAAGLRARMTLSGNKGAKVTDDESLRTMIGLNCNQSSVALSL